MKAKKGTTVIIFDDMSKGANYSKEALAAANSHTDTKIKYLNPQYFDGKAESDVHAVIVHKYFIGIADAYRIAGVDVVTLPAEGKKTEEHPAKTKRATKADIQAAAAAIISELPKGEGVQ